jgi:hypothetical protein
VGLTIRTDPGTTANLCESPEEKHNEAIRANR